MAFSHGKDGKFRLGTTGTPASLVDISAYLSSVSFPLSKDTAEVTALGDAARERIAGLRDGSISIEGHFDPTIDAQLEGCLNHTGATLITYDWTPQVGGPVYSGSCICTSYEVSGDVGDKVSFSAEFELSGTVTRT